jgi:hypothetical protein
MNDRFVAALFFAAALPLAGGCKSPCADVKADWEKWRSETSPFVAPGEESDAIHMGVALRVATLNRLLDAALTSKMDEALEFTDKLTVATGNAIGVRTDGNVVDLGLFPDKACENCLRVEGKLDGKLAVKIPVLGEQAVPLRGTFQLVGPVDFGTTDDGKGTIVLDLTKVADINASRVTAEIAQLPPSWKDALESPLSSRILRAVGEKLGPVTLFTFEPLDLEIDGLKVRPVKLATDAKEGIVFAGFSTNLRGVETGLSPYMELAANENAAFVLEPGIVGAAATALQRANKLSEIYDAEGKAAKAGPFRAAVQMVSTATGDDSATGYQTRFRVWNLDERDSCYWANATAIGRATIENDEVKLAVDDVELTESSMNGVKMAIANWAFLSRVDKVIASSLSAQTLEVPGSKLVLRAGNLKQHGTGLAVSGKLVDAP